MRSFIDFMYCLSRYSHTHLLATVARHQLNKKGGHSSEEDRQNFLPKPVNDTNFGVKSYWLIVTGLALQFIGEKWLSFLVSKKINFINRMSRTCYKKPISESLSFAHSKLEKMAMKSKKTKKSVLKRFQIKENTYSVVIVKNDKDDPLEPLVYFISTLQDKTEIVNGSGSHGVCFKHSTRS